MSMEQEPLTREEAGALPGGGRRHGQDAVKALRPSLGRLAREAELPGAVQ